MVDRPPPASAAPEPEKKQGFGEMTRAWFDAGSEVADYEAGRNAERRRVVVATVGVIALVAVVAVVLVLL